MNNKLLWMVVGVLILGLVMGAAIIMIKNQPGASAPAIPMVQAPVTTLPTSFEKAQGLMALEKAYDQGLGWLMNQQLEDGSWPDLEKKSDVAFTALAIISLSGARATDQAKYQTRREAAIKYLLDHQQTDGSFVDPDKMPSMIAFKTPLSLLALISIDPNKYQGPILKARSYLEGAQDQDPEQPGLFGGWSETGKDPTPKPGMVPTNFTIDALKQAGLPPDSATWKRAVVFLQRCQDSSAYNEFRTVANSGGFVHSPLDSKAGEETLPDGTKILKPYGSMTHAGLMSFLYAFVNKNDSRVRATYAWLQHHYTLEENPGLRTDIKPESGQQGLYYYYYTLAKALDTFGDKIIITLPDKAEHAWAEELIKKLARLQRPEGSWGNTNPRWWEDNPLIVTPYCLIALTTCRKWVK